jgi:hypothetical protein
MKAQYLYNLFGILNLNNFGERESIVNLKEKRTESESLFSRTCQMVLSSGTAGLLPFVWDGSIGLKIKGILRIEEEREIQLKAERKWQSSSESFRLQL